MDGYKSKKNNPDLEINNNKKFRSSVNILNSLIGKANLNLYGTDRTPEIDSLNSKFQEILKGELGDITNNMDGDVSSFLGQIISSDRKDVASDDFIKGQFMSLTGNEFSSLQSTIYNAYRNKLLEQNDLHEVSSQLIELSEAILITRDAIISPDVVEGRMSRTLKFENLDENEELDNIEIVEKLEEKFGLLTKIKDFIIPQTLEYGEYYVYVIPYAKLFKDFQNQKNSEIYGSSTYHHSFESTGNGKLSGKTIMESFSDSNKDKYKNRDNNLNLFLEECYDKYTIQSRTAYKKESSSDNEIPKDEFFKDLKNIMGNIMVDNNNIPLPILEEGFESIEYLKRYKEKMFTEAQDVKSSNKNDDLFSRINNTSEGIQFEKDRKKTEKNNDFLDIGDCYVKLIDPTRIIPIEIVNTVIGYYYVQDEDITPLSGVVSSSLYYTKFDEHSRNTSIIDSIAEKVVKLFDKPFLKNNLKFKEAIVDCFNYYNLNEKRVKFQFIPAEYIVPFKIDVDVNGHGTSMIKKSLFYAKLYLMLLLFKLMSIFVYSNDQRINYVRQNGIDKNVANTVQEIIRLRQSRQLNISDMFSYTSLINKVGAGQQTYIPMGRGDRPLETEVISGQDIDLNTPLMETLKNSYILGTGVPAAIVNYLNEAEFAKVVEQNNTKFHGRVVNYQLNFNDSITMLYKKIMLWSSNIKESAISNFLFILQPPKTTSINTKSELIGQYNSLADFLVGLFYNTEMTNDDPNYETTQANIRKFKQFLAEEQLPMINFTKIREIMEKAEIDTLENKLKPSSDNSSDGDDIGLDDSDLKL